MPPDLAQRVLVGVEEVLDLRSSRGEGGGPRPSWSDAPRARCRWSSAPLRGTGSPPTRSAAAGRRCRRNSSSPVSHQAAARTVRWWWRESSHTDLTLPVTASSRWSMRNASRSWGARRPVTGSRNQSGSTMSGRGVPSRTSRRRGAGRRRRRRQPRPRREPGRVAPAGAGSGTRGRPARPAGRSAPSPGRTCLRAQTTCRACVRAPDLPTSLQATSDGPRRTYQPSSRVTVPPPSRWPGWLAAAIVARVVVGQGAEVDRHGGARRGPRRGTLQLGPWPLSWPAERALDVPCRRGSTPWPG